MTGKHRWNNSERKDDLVYLHDPTHKRGKAKKFSYQYKYKGPFEIESKMLPLIYKIRTADGTSIVLHVIRLKRAHGQMPKWLLQIATPFRNKTGRTEQHEKFSLGEGEDMSDADGVHSGIKSNPQVEEMDIDS